MKKTFIIIAILAFGLSMAGCSFDLMKGSMEVSRAELTEQESQIVGLIKGDAGSAIFDFTADGDAKTVSVACYNLDENGKWELHSGWSNLPVTQASGRIAVSFTDLDVGLRVAAQTGDTLYASENSSSASDAPVNTSEEIGSSTSYAETDHIEYEKEIPLVMQVFTRKIECSTCDITLFNKPEELKSFGYDEVYVVVAKFSKRQIL